jgi:dTDP-4-dehydrorhamnose reductase
MRTLGKTGGIGINMQDARIVVTGGAGMLGHKLFQRLAEKFPEVYCTIREDPNAEPVCRIPLLHGPKVIQGVDVTDFEALQRTLRALQPDYVVNCVGIIKQRDEARSAIPSILINSLLPHKLAEMAAGWGGRVIHFSTDCVFSGKRGGYVETDDSDADDMYGKSKFLGEVAGENGLTLRTSIIGRELVEHRSLLDWFLSQNHRKVRGFRRVIYSGVTTNYMADVVAKIIDNYPKLHGLYQVVSDPISKYDLLSLLRDAYGLDIDIEAEDQTISDRSMKGDKLCSAIGHQTPPWPELVRQLSEDPTLYESRFQ